MAKIVDVCETKQVYNLSLKYDFGHFTILLKKNWISKFQENNLI
jgi:hypothetical protein